MQGGFEEQERQELVFTLTDTHHRFYIADEEEVVSLDRNYPDVFVHLR